MRLSVVLLLGLILSSAYLLASAVPMTQVALAQSPPTNTAAKTPNQVEIGKLIQQLGSEAFEEREAAEQKLQKIGEPALKQLYKTMSTTRDLEVLERSRQIIREIERNLFGITAVYKGHLGAVNAVALLANGTLGLSADRRAVYVWDLQKNKVLREFTEHADRVMTLSIHPKGKIVASGGEDNTIRLWELDTLKELHLLRGHIQAVRHLAFSRNGHYLVSGGLDGRVVFWDIKTGKALSTFDHGAGVFAVAFGPDNRTVVSAGRKSEICVWDVKEGKLVRSLQGHSETIMSVALSSDGTRLLSAGLDKTIRYWDVKLGKLVRVYSTPEGGEINAVAFGGDNEERIISVGADARLRIRDLLSGRELRNFTGHTDTIWSLSLTGGVHALTGGEDASLRLWKLGK